MKRTIALFLALCLCLNAASALAAPARDVVKAEVAIAPGMQMLAETVLGAAVFTRTRGLEEDMYPSPALVEAAYALGLYNLSLPHDGQDLMDNQVTLAEAEVKALYPLLFASGAYNLSGSTAVTGVSRTAGGLSFDLNELRDAPWIGVYIYSAALAQEGGAREETLDDVELEADLFSYYGDAGADAEELPEDALTWLCHAEMTLRPAPDTAYGYQVASFALSEQYEDGMLADWQEIENAQCEYSVNLPSIFGLAQEDPRHMLWQTADGSAEIRIDVDDKTDAGVDQLLAAWLQKHPGRAVVQQPEYGVYYSLGDSDYELWVTSPEIDSIYILTLTFPPERQAEYGLYSEFIRNSMIVWGISNG